MGKNSIRLLLLVLLGALAACSSGEDPVVYWVPEDGSSNKKQEDVKSFLQQNLDYSTIYIQNALDEKPDARVLTLLQKDKQKADKELIAAKKKVLKKDKEITRLEKRKAELEGQVQEAAELENPSGWRLKLQKIINTLNLVKQREMKKRLSELEKVTAQLKQANIDLVQFENERDQAERHYQNAAASYASHSAQIKAKVDQQAELERLNDMALSELYSTL